MIKRLVVILSCLLFSFHSFAQQYRPLNNNQIYEKLQQLNQLGTVMYLAAHPDDENTRLLSFLVHEKHYKTVYLSLTRGDGGQNLIGNELGIELGLIRNYELIAARNIDGAEQAFTSVIDFGYTKNPEETFGFWNQQQLVDEVKEVIKYYRPDVIICRFPTTGEGGHGQHTASAIVARDAFDQLQQEAYPYLAERVLFNAFRFGNRSTIKESQFRVPTNQYNYLLGESYGEMAGRSRSIHRSQGAGTPQNYGINDEYFEVITGTEIKDKLIDKDLSWNRVQAPEIGKMIDQIIQDFDFKNPAASISGLIAVRKKIKSLPAQHDFWKTQKLEEIDRIILSCAGVMSEIFTQHAEAIALDTFTAKFKIIARTEGLSLKSLQLPNTVVTYSYVQTNLLVDTVFEDNLFILVDEQQPITQPYWLTHAHSTFRYQNPAQLHFPETPNSFFAKVTLLLQDEEFTLDVPISYKYLSPTHGDVVQPLRIVPEVFVRPQQSLLFVPHEGKMKLQFWIKSNIGKNNKTVFTIKNENHQVVFSTSISLPEKGKDSLFTFEVDAKELQHSSENWSAEVTLVNGKKYGREQRLINYEHLPELVYYKDAKMKMVKADWLSSKKKIGYIAGAGDQVYDIMKDLGLNVSLIPDAQLSKLEVLNSFDVLITGVRAFNTNHSLVQNRDLIWKFIEDGGNFIVQYNTSMHMLTPDIGPYPFKLGRARVTDETAKVTITDQNARILNYPNQITLADFEDWVQERGLYFAEDLAPEYKTFMSMSDPGETALNNATFYAPYGKGNYIYTSLSLFRQLPAGNSGSIRLLMNMLEL